MTEASYQHHAMLGVTGPATNTCMLASFDRLSMVKDVRQETYEARNAFDDRMELLNQGIDPVPYHLVMEGEDTLRALCSDLGVADMKTVVYNRADTENELRSSLAALSLLGYRAAVELDVGSPMFHTVGVQPVGKDVFAVKSTWSPFPEGEPVDVHNLFPLLDRMPRYARKRFRRRLVLADDCANIIALPPEILTKLP